jgi:hydroxymethylbilane synthase
MIKNKFIIGTRGSKLALWQANYVKEALQNEFPNLNFEVIKIKTKGDKILDSPLSKIGSKGLFTKEIENALIREEIDFAVHSLKDLPTSIDNRLKISAIMKRDDPRDIIISKNNLKLSELPVKATIATSSLRRKAQLLNFRNDFEIVDIRGNIDTRIRKFDESDLDALILAKAGVVRMGYQERISEILSVEIMLPAAGQGAVAIEILKKNKLAEDITSTLNDKETELTTYVERSFLNHLGGGCQVPIGVLAQIDGNMIKMDGMIATIDGKRVIKGFLMGDIKDFKNLGKQLAEDILNRGGSEILESIRE